MSDSLLDQAQNIKDYLWATYDPHDEFIFPTISKWDDLLRETIEADSYDNLNKAEVLSILFGLIHRNRICEGLWWSFFECGTTQKLMERLLALDSD